MELRAYRSSDCREITELFYDTVHTVNAGDYSLEQLDAWADGHPDLPEWDRSLSSHTALTAVEDGRIVGFGDVDASGYLDRLYVHSACQGRGIASALCDALEKAAGTARIVTHASITARPFFAGRGYRTVREQQVTRRGVLLTNFVMEKRLPSGRTHKTPLIEQKMPLPPQGKGSKIRSIQTYGRNFMNTAYDAHCWAEIDLDALVHNFRLIQQRAGDAAVCAVVKADAYGHGDGMVARTLAEAGAAWFAVSSLAEARHLRREGVAQPILILGMTRPACAAALAEEQITQAIYSPEYARALSEAANAAGVTVEGHLKIDTGMGRIGFGARRDPEAAAGALLECRRLKGLSITGAFQHFSVADSLTEDDVRYTQEQYALFRRMVEQLETAGPLKTVHCSNSAGLAGHPDWSCDMVRAGVILYGQDPSGEVRFPGLRPVMTVKTVVSQVKTLSPGDCVGYGRAYTADRALPAATLCCGYADGYPRALSNLGTASLHGKAAPVIGRVSMDQLVVDVSAIPEAAAGDEAVLLGAAPADSFTQAAEKAGTISYELLCAVARRVPRVYLQGGKVVRVLDYLNNA